MDDSLTVNLVVNNELMIYAFRILVKRGVIPHNNIVFKFKEQVIRLDRNGRIECYPHGFSDTLDNILMELLPNESDLS